MENKIHIPQKLAILTLLHTLDTDVFSFIGDVESFISSKGERVIERIAIVATTLPDLALLNGCYKIVRQPDIEFKGSFEEHYSCTIHFDEFSDIRIEILIKPKFEITGHKHIEMFNTDLYTVDQQSQTRFLEKQIEELSKTDFVELKNTYSRQLIQYING